MLAKRNAPGVAVGKNLRSGGIGRIDFAINTKYGYPGLFGPPHAGNRTIGIGAIEQNRFITSGNQVFKVGAFLGGITLRIKNRGIVAQLFATLLSRVGEYHKPRIVECRHDDGDFLFFA